MLQDQQKSKFPEFESYTVVEEEGSGKIMAMIVCGYTYQSL